MVAALGIYCIFSGFSSLCNAVMMYISSMTSKFFWIFSSSFRCSITYSMPYHRPLFPIIIDCLWPSASKKTKLYLFFGLLFVSLNTNVCFLLINTNATHVIACSHLVHFSFVNAILRIKYRRKTWWPHIHFSSPKRRSFIVIISRFIFLNIGLSCSH